MNKVFAILIMCSLSLPVLATEAPEASIPFENVDVIEDAASDITSKEVDIEPIPTYKQPISKKKLAKKFIIAMLCVAGTSIFLYGSLSVYNKLREGFSPNTPTPPEGEKPLDTPGDLTEAIKTFIDKTHWEG